GDGDFARHGLGVVIECLLTKIVTLIGHGGPRYGSELSGALARPQARAGDDKENHRAFTEESIVTQPLTSQ
ncbi:hypothetical protein, partial [Aeromonas salmonicida]|uniref:hypothetical protein n=1 Tax=Aeromonas salmonicida TaxID=645 RepID=UPI0035A3A537